MFLYAHLAENIPGAPPRLSMHMPLSSAIVGKQCDVNSDANLAFIKALSLNDLPFSIGSFLVKLFKDKTSMLLPTKILLNSSSLFLFWVAINN